MSVTQVLTDPSEPSLRLFRMNTGHAMIADETRFEYRYYSPKGKPLHRDSIVAIVMADAVTEWELAQN